MYSSRLHRSLAGALFLLTSQAWAGTAGGSITYEPLAAASVPTLGEWSVTLMALLVAVIAYRALKGRVGTRFLANLAMAGGALASVVAGHGWIREAQAAAGYPELSMTQASGGTVSNIPTGTAKIFNHTSVPQKIVAVTPVFGSTVTPPGAESPVCEVNLVLDGDAHCYVNFQVIPPSIEQQ